MNGCGREQGDNNAEHEHRRSFEVAARADASSIVGIRRTAFQVPSAKIERLPGFYFFNHQTNTLDVFDDVANTHGELSRHSNRAEAGSSRRSMTILLSAA